MRVRLPLFTAALLALSAALSAFLSGCASAAPEPVMSTQGSTMVQTGRVTNIRDIALRGGRPSGVGTFIGSIVGGVAGSKIGSGSGSMAAGIGGAVAGGMAGQRVEEAGMNSTSTELTVQLDTGEHRIYRVDPDEPFRIGDTVRITTVNGVSRIVRP